MNRIPLSLAACVLVGGAFVSVVRANDNPHDVALAINRANAQLRNGDVNGAICAYEKVQKQAPANSELSYDLAVAQYRQGDLTAAQRLFQATAANHDHALVAKARYNLGNCNYASALSQAKTAPAEAIGSLDQAIENYRSALALDNADSDARTNLELAAALRDKLRRQPSEAQQSQAPQAGPPSPHDQQSANDQRSKSQQPATGQPQTDNQHSESPTKNNRQDQKSQAGGQPGQSTEQRDHNDKQGGQETKSANPKTADQQQRSPGAAQQNQVPSKSSNSQLRTPENSERNNATNGTIPQSRSPAANGAPKPRPPAARSKRDDSKKPAAQAMEQPGTAAPQGALTPPLPSGGTPGQPGQAQAVDRDAATDNPMTQQEAEKMLQSIRDRDMLRRFERQAAERNRRVPVDRDW